MPQLQLQLYRLLPSVGMLRIYVAVVVDPPIVAIDLPRAVSVVVDPPIVIDDFIVIDPPIVIDPLVVVDSTNAIGFGFN